MSADDKNKATERPDSSLSSDDDPILDFSATQVTMPLDDEDPRVLRGQSVMCSSCRLFSKPMCTHNQPIRTRVLGGLSHGSNHVNHGYEALIQEEATVQELQQNLGDLHCHGHAPPKCSRREAVIRLALTSGFCFLFMLAEWLGGYLANSLAVMSDAAHLLSDFGSFLLSMFAIWMSMRHPTRKMTFGFYRAEVLGAVISVLTIWIVTAVLVYMAVERMVHGNYDVDADTMLIVAGVGVLVNIVSVSGSAAADGRIPARTCPQLGANGGAHCNGTWPCAGLS